MICFFVTRSHRYTIDGFLRGWMPPALARRIVVAPYDSLADRDVLRARTFVFTDLERLTPAQRSRAAGLADHIESSDGHFLNRPERVLCRYDLLRSLCRAGRNPFNAFRVAADGTATHRLPSCRYPVFVREENEHTGALTELLHDADQLAAALKRLAQARPRGLAELLIVEYCDTRAADGTFRKYAAMRIGDRFVPRHLLVSRDWVDKYPDIVDAEAARAERDFLNAYPHADAVRAAFDLGGIDYGRIDYSCDAAGRIVTWEINTNPLIVPPPQECDSHRLDTQSVSARRIVDALSALDGPDVRVELSRLAPIGVAGRPSGWVALKSVTLSHAPLARQVVRMVKSRWKRDGNTR